MSTFRHALTYQLELGSQRLPLGRVEGHEALGAPFRFDVALPATAAQGIEPERYLRAEAAIVIDDCAGGSRTVHGIVTDLSVMAAAGEGTNVVMTIEPAFALARLRVDSAVFREATTVEIVASVLARYRVTVESRLRQSYEERPQCIQYQERDLDFVHRLLEEEGIFYFSTARDRLVLVDDPAGWDMQTVPPIPFNPGAALERGGEAVTELAERADLGPRGVSVRTSRLDRVRHDPQAFVEACLGNAGVRDVWARGQERRDVAAAAARLARAHRFESASIEGRAASVRVLPGVVFEIEGSGLADSARVRLVCTELWHATSDQAVSWPRFRARLAEQPCHPLPRTPRPEVSGPAVAFVVGPEGEEIHTDPFGRVKIRYPWDRNGQATDAASHWAQVAQDMSGHSCETPRVGWEVLVDYLDGDPDRPVILGRLYNAAHPFPESLPEQKTVSSLRSHSSPGRGGANEVRIDDAAGAESMRVLAERDQDVSVKNDRRLDVGADRVRQVTGQETVAVGADLVTGTGGEFTLSVGGAASLRVGGDASVWSGMDAANAVQKNYGLQVGGGHFRRVVLDDRVTARAIDESVGGVALEASLFGISTEAKQTTAVLVGGAFVDVAFGGSRVSTGVARAEVVGAMNVSTSGRDTTIKARTRTLTVGGAYLLDAGRTVTLAAPDLEIDAATTLGVEGATSIVLRITKDGAAVSELVLAAGEISIKAPRLIVEASGAASLGWGKASFSEG